MVVFTKFRVQIRRPIIGAENHPMSYAQFWVSLLLLILLSCGGNTSTEPDSSSVNNTLVSIRISPYDTVAYKNSSILFRIAGLNSDGQRIEGLKYNWLSINETIASIDSNGNAKCLDAGVTEIVAENNTIRSNIVLLKVKPTDEIFVPSIRAGQTTGYGVFYKKVVPDENLFDNSFSPEWIRYGLDMDNDGIIDFEFGDTFPLAGNNYDKYIILTPLQGHSVHVDGQYKSQADSILYSHVDTTSFYPSLPRYFDFFQQWIDKMDDNVIIEDSLEWSSSVSTFYYIYRRDGLRWGWIFGEWEHNEEKFVGVGLNTNEGYMYGWIRILFSAQRSSETSIHYIQSEVLDFAYKLQY